MSEEDAAQRMKVKELIARFNAWEDASLTAKSTNEGHDHAHKKVDRQVQQGEEGTIGDGESGYGEESGTDYAEDRSEVIEYYETYVDETAIIPGKKKQGEDGAEDAQEYAAEELDEEGGDDADSGARPDMSKYELTDDDVEDAAAKLSMETAKIHMYAKGVDCYAFVKYNGGMLKAVTLFFHPITGRLYITRCRNGHVSSLFLPITHFSEVDCTKGCCNYLAKNMNDPYLEAALVVVNDQPHFVVWTSERPELNKSAGFLGKFRNHKKNNRSLVFVFDDPAQRDTLCDLVEKTNVYHGVKGMKIHRAEKN